MRLPRAFPALALGVLFVIAAPSSASPQTDDQAGGDLVVARLAVGSLALSDDGSHAGESDQYAQFRVPPGVDTDAYMEQLRASGLVDLVYRDTYVYAAAEPDDPIYIGSSASQKDYLDTIGAAEAWDLATSGEVIVAVLDSGMDLDHPDLRDQLWVNPGEVPGNGIDDDGNGCVDDVHGCRFINPDVGTQAVCGYPPGNAATGAVSDDDGDSGFGNHSHGTLVSGIIGATGNNGEGVTGVAWNVRIMVIKVLDCGTPGGLPRGNMDDVRRGIEYATRMGAHVINLSLASAPNDPSADQPGVRAAIEAAREANIIVVAAAGNRGSTGDPAPGYPAAYTQYENVIGVGASDWRAGNVWAQFSRYGPGVDFAAPGTNISSTIRSDINGVDLYGSVNGGTSYSAPLVTGMFALLAARNPNLPFETYIDAARQTAQTAAPATHGGNWAGDGIIDIGAAIRRIPMIITGSALHDWLDLPAGALVQARISGKVCGSAVSESFGSSRISRFELTVDTDAVNIGCGQPGRQVNMFIDGQPAVPMYPWGGQDEPLAHISQDVSTVTPDPGPIVVQPMSTGWNNVAHFDATAPLPGAFSYLPGSWTAAYSWDPLTPSAGGFGEYRRIIKNAPAVTGNWNTVQRYEAYWVDAGSDTVASTVNPNPPKSRHAFFEPGWNNFVYTGTSQAIEDALENLAGLYTTVLQHDNETGEWATFVPGRARPLNGIGGLLFMQVYWIYMEKPGGFTMD